MLARMFDDITRGVTMPRGAAGRREGANEPVLAATRI